MSVLTAPGGVTGSDSRQIARDASSLLTRCISVLASLKLTVVLFVLGMVIVFIGSLAQARRDVWQVMDDYFRCYVAKIDVQDLFPRPCSVNAARNWQPAWDRSATSRFLVAGLLAG